MTDDLNQVMKIRREKLDLLRETGHRALRLPIFTDPRGRRRPQRRFSRTEEAAGALDEDGHGTVRSAWPDA